MSQLNNWKVLLVDDEPDSLNMIHDMLMLTGVEVHSAVSGSVGLSLMDSFTPTLVIVDLSMPKPDGWDILHTIRASPETAELPVVAITAYSSDKVVAEARQAGFNALLSKPIKINSLITKLKEVVG
jgi:two-component system CheB/CheR fusion protein